MSRDGRSTQRAARGRTRRGAAEGRRGCAVAATAQRARDGVAGAWAAGKLGSRRLRVTWASPRRNILYSIRSPRRDISYALTTARQLVCAPRER
jgi:hypothetical protein